LGAKSHLTSDAALWIGVLGPPVAWAADETVSYALVKWACGHQAGSVLHAITLATLTIIAASAMVSWSAERGNERARFMGSLGLMTATLFFLLVVATAIPKWTLNVCQ
jgi:MFS-type transporter involved in bile tolerance (Atg22 family)